MRPVTGTIALGVSLALLSAAPRAQEQPQPSAEEVEMRRQIAALHWIHGPQHVELYNKSALDVPAGYMFLNSDDTAKLETLTRNIGGGNQYFLAPEDFRWEAFFDYSDDGYVKDDQKIDADAILSGIKRAPPRPTGNGARRAGTNSRSPVGRPHRTTMRAPNTWSGPSTVRI